jgi:hypothetical protein
MSAKSFRGISMVASCAAAALGCYLVSLRVASERAAVEAVETEIVMAKRDIRVLQTEIGTRGRLAQLERWNVKVLALSAPSADQILGGGFELAKLVAPPHKAEITAPMVLASAPADAPRPQVEGAARHDDDGGVPTSALLHQTSLTRDIPGSDKAVVAARRAPVATTRQAEPRPVTTAARKSATIAASKLVSLPVARRADPAIPSKLTKAPVAAKVAVAAAAKPAKAINSKKVAAADPLAPLAGPPKKILASAIPRKSSAKEPARKP